MKLDDIKINQIDAAANDVLEDVFGDIDHINLPINLTDILNKNNIVLEYGNFPAPDIAGAFDRESMKILVSNNDTYERQAFTIAHELGHIILHTDKNKEVFYRYDSINLDKEDKQEETEANWFAASLLMPEPLVRKFWVLTKDPKALSDIFGVSNTAMFFRLKHLGLL